MSTLKTAKVKTTTIADELDTESTAVTNVINGSAKAWVNFDGTGTVAIRESFNVNSITDNGTANYTINFTNALADANYTLASMQGHKAGDSAARAVVYDQDLTKTTTALQIMTVNDFTNYYDSGEVHVIVFR